MFNQISSSSFIQDLQSTLTTDCPNARFNKASAFCSEADSSDEVRLDNNQLVPSELLFRIFEFLSPADQGRASCVCREWQNVATDSSLFTYSSLQREFPNLQILSEREWVKHFDVKAKELDFSDAPPLEPKMIRAFKEMFASLQMNGTAKISLMIMPRFFSLNTLPEEKKGYISKDFYSHYCNFQTYRFAITNSTLAGTEGMNYDEQTTLLKENGCQLPQYYEVAAVSILTNMDSPLQSPTYLFNNLTRCDNLDNHGRPMAAGFNGYNNLFMINGFYEYGGPDTPFIHGAAAVQKF